MWTSVHAGQEAPESLPVYLPPRVYDSTGSSGSTCPSQDTINDELRRARETILNYFYTNTSYISSPDTTSVSDTTNSPSTNYSPICSYGGEGWTRIAHLNMSDPNQQCPSNFAQTIISVRGGGTGLHSCSSVFYPVNGRTYSSVCGRVNACGVSAFFAQTMTLR